MGALFCNLELAARVERAESSLLRDAATQVAARHPERATAVFDVGGGVCAVTAPNSPLNKVCGVGFGEQPTEDDWSRVEATCFGAGVRVQVEVSTAAEPALVAALTGRGYKLVGFENVSALVLSEWQPAPGADVQVARSPDSRREEWLDAVITGFANPDDRGVASHESYPREVLGPIIEDFTSGADLRCYLATVAGEPKAVGGGSLRVHDRLGQLCGAATLPGFRRRGVQTALLAHRLLEARDEGCDLATVTTQPGSTSEQNMRRFGFQLLYPRAVLVREAPDAARPAD
ncbi:MAG: GNAT family N-acetyltransferase [Planctomycetota bacterium]|nr:GNAT family N-acetyltransferase [Planctomycetota bacterium]